MTHISSQHTQGPNTCFQSAQPSASNDNGSIRRGWPGFEGVIARGMNSDSYPLPDAPCLPVSGSHWCSQGSRSRQAQRSMAQGPLEFCWRENHLGRVQPEVTGILQLLSKMKRLPAGGGEDMCLCVHITPTTDPRHTHTCITEDRIRDALQISTNPRSLLLILGHSGVTEQGGQQTDAQPPSWTSCHIILLTRPIPSLLGWTQGMGTEQLCDGCGMAPSDPAAGAGTYPRNRDLLPVVSCHEIAGSP